MTTSSSAPLPESVTSPHDADVKMNVMDREQESEVRQALQSLQDEFLPVKENIVTLPRPSLPSVWAWIPPWFAATSGTNTTA